VNQSPKPSKDTGQAVMAAILVGAVLVSAVGTFLPGLIGLDGAPALVMELAFYAIAVADVALAFWLRARIRKARGLNRDQNNRGPVQRQ
jgi:hypothetical protein